MAATPKIKVTTEQIQKAEDDIVRAVEVSGEDAVAAALGKTTDFVKGVVEKGLNTKVGRELVKGVEGLDEKLLELRTPKTGQTPPPAFTGAMAPSPGGPLVPAQSRALSRVSEGLVANEIAYDPITKAPMSTQTAVVPYGSRMERPTTSTTEVAEAAGKAKPRPAGVGVSELTPEAKTRIAEESRLQAERAADLGLGLDLEMKPSAKTVRRAGLGVAGVGAAAAGYRLLDNKSIVEQPEAGQTTVAAGLESPKEAVNLANTAVQSNALPEEAKQQQMENAQKIESIADVLERRLAAKEKAYDTAVARKELLQALETMMHGLVTAIGAKALLDRGSPYAVDFSKGPRVDWESQYNRLQKDFELQTNALIKKYGMEQELQIKQEQAAESKRRAAERTAIEREKLDIQREKLGIQRQEKEQKRIETLSTQEQKQYKDNLKNFALLKEAIQNKKAGDVEEKATLLGADDATIQQLKDSMSKGMWSKLLDQINPFTQPDKAPEEILQGLRPKRPTAAPTAQSVQADEVVVELNGVQGAIPANQVDAFVKANPGAKIIK